MLKKIVHRLLRHRHFWRGVSFNELSELYVSTMLRMMAISLLMVFVPFYLYQNGYGLAAIFITFASFFVTRVFSDVIAGYTVARFGPKHTMIAACLLQIISALLFLNVPSRHWQSWILGIPWGMSASFYFISFHVEFSKIKHLRHAGKEIGYMNIMEKIGAIIGPLAGGLVGTYIGPGFIFLVAVIVLVGSLVPLFRSHEPVRTHQRLDFRRFPVHKAFPDLRAYAALGVENTLGINLWPLYLGLFALQGKIYAQLGGLTSVAVLASVASAYFAGSLLDIHGGRQLLRIAAYTKAVTYAFRPFVHSLFPALAVSIVNDAVIPGYRMPFMKGMYAAVDDMPGYRIVYIVTMESFACAIKATAWLSLAIMAQFLTGYMIFVFGFALSAVAVLLITTEQFKALNHRATIKGGYNG